MIKKREQEKDMEVKALTSDVIFKAVFLREEKVLLRMIKDILNIKDELKDTLTIIGYEVPPYQKDGKTNRGDMLVKLSDDSFVSIEMNAEREGDILSRNIIQMARIYTSLSKKGDENTDIVRKLVSGINLNGFRTFTGKPHEHIALCEIDSGMVVSFLLSFYNIDIELCKKLLYNVDVSSVDKQVRWGALLCATNTKTMTYIIGDDLMSKEEKKEFIQAVKDVNNDEKIIQDWMWEENEKLRKANVLATAKEDGIKIGIGQKEKELIINMIKNNLAYKTISEITGKSTREIEEIAKEVNN